MAFEGLQRLKL